MSAPAHDDPKVMLTVVTNDDSFSVEFALRSTTLGQLKAALELDTGIPVHRQMLMSNGIRLVDSSQTLSQAGIGPDDMVMLDEDEDAETSAAAAAQAASQLAATSAGAPSAAAPASGSDSGTGGPAPAPGLSRGGPAAPVDETAILNQLREQLLANPQAMSQLRASHPQAATAVETGDTQGLRQLIETQRSVASAQMAEQASLAELAAADPFDPAAQARIEEAIRQERVLENLEHAMEYSPESFGRVTMLYVDTWVEGTPVKAFVDSGAQATIMSPQCAERCGIMRLIDRRFQGVARGVGEAKILGRVHSAQIRLGPTLFLPCSFTIMENKSVDLLFGLDMLRRFQACIDLRKNCLVVGDQEIRFLDEHELPPQARAEARGEFPEAPELPDPSDPSNPSTAAHADGFASAPTSAPAPAPAGPAGASDSSTSFPGQGRALGTSSAASTPAVSSSASSAAQSASQAGSRAAAGSGPSFPPTAINALKDLGASDAQATQLLQASGGNVEVAASLLFQS